MARRAFSNTAVSTTLSAGIASGDLSLTVVSASGYPAAPFTIVLDQTQVTEEVVLVGAKAGTTFSSLTRGYDGTSAAAHSSGATCKHVLVAADLDDANAHRFASPASAGDTDAAAASIHHTLDTVAPTTSAVADAAGAGTALKAAARDHRHGRESFASPAASAVGDAQGAGSATTIPRSDHVHAREAFATNTITLSTAAGAGSATTLVRSDAVIAAFDATSPSTQAFSDAAATGSAAFAARRDHKHAMPANPATFATPAIVLGSSAAAGAASTVIRSDATIAAFDATVPVTQAFGDSAAAGSAAFAARRDHKHGMPSGPASGSDTGDVATSQTTTSGSYTDLATAGPSATVTVGSSGVVLIIVESQSSNPANTSFMGFAATGANTIAAADVDAAQNANASGVMQSRHILKTGLAAGSTVFTAKYKTSGGSTGTFANRRIIAIPL